MQYIYFLYIFDIIQLEAKFLGISLKFIQFFFPLAGSSLSPLIQALKFLFLVAFRKLSLHSTVSGN